MTVTFFGHSDAPLTLRPLLRRVIEKLIIEDKADRFLVGNHGAFDSMTKHTLTALQVDYSHIDYAVVLAYLPTDNYDSPTIYPEGLEKVPHRFAICKRNEWMIEQSDIVVTYVTRGFGGAARFKQQAERIGKRVINLANKE